jgi:hypothetical protein
VQSFDSTLGAYGGSNVHGNAAIASNGDLTFSNSCHIHSEAHPGIGGTIIKDGGTQINASTPYNTGSRYPILSPATANLTTALYYPQVTPPSTNDNALIASKLDASNNFSCGDYAMPGGTYVVRDFTVIAGKHLTGQGPIIVYATGNVTIDGECKAYLTATQNFLLYVTGSGSVNMPFDKVFYGSVYAPTSTVFIDGADFYGQVIGKTLTLNPNHMRYDEAMAAGTAGGPTKKKWIKHPSKWKTK